MKSDFEGSVGMYADLFLRAGATNTHYTRNISSKLLIRLKYGVVKSLVFLQHHKQSDKIAACPRAKEPPPNICLFHKIQHAADNRRSLWGQGQEAGVLPRSGELFSSYVIVLFASRFCIYP